MGNEDFLDDDIPAVPLYQDIYDEQIPEMSEDHEASSFHTKKFPLRMSLHSKVYYEAEDLLESHRSSEGDFIGSIR